jgi:adenylyltransferase/sulfurtransferase
MSLSPEEKYRYSRHLLLDGVGVDGQEKLRAAKILVIGAGGLGCPVLQYLTAAGVGTIGLIDFDKIDETNLQRQILFTTNDIGKSKALTAKDKLEANNPFITVDAYDFALTNKNALDLFEKYDLVIDGTDNFSTRYLVNDACLLTNKPLIYGAIHKFEGQVSVFNYEDGPNYRCLFPDPPSPGSVPSCSEVGVIGVLPGLIGTQQANEAIKIIVGIGNVLSGRLLVYNALQSTQMEFKIPKKVKLGDFGITDKSDFENFDYVSYCETTKSNESGINKEELSELPEDAFVLDVRESWEKPALENKNLLNAPLDEIENFIGDIPKEQTVYVVCQRGVRSKAAIDVLEKEYNFTNLINVDGGLLG